MEIIDGHSKKPSVVTNNRMGQVTKVRAIIVVLIVTAVVLAAVLGYSRWKADNAPVDPPDVTLTIEPSTVEYGAGAIISWQTSNTLQMTIVGVGDVSSLLPNGSYLIYPGNAQTNTVAIDSYEAQAISSTTSATVSAVVTVNPAPPSPQYLEFFAWSDITPIRLYDISENQIISVQIASTSTVLNLMWNVAYCSFLQLSYTYTNGTPQSMRVSAPFGAASIPLENLQASSVTLLSRFHTQVTNTLQLLVVLTY